MNIIDFKSFHIEDKSMIDGFFKIHHYEQIDCTFNTLFLWQDAHNTRWAVKDDILFICAGEGKEHFFLPPFAHREEDFIHGLQLIHEELEGEGKEFRLKSASPWVTEQIEKLFPGKYDFIEDRDNEEYVYRTADMISLPGKKLRMKKNHLNSFLRQYGDYQYESITPANMADAKEGIHEWFLRHGDIEEEEEAISRSFDYWEELGMKGALIRIYGKVEAFTSGDLVNERMAHIIFEKANPNIRGLYQAINRDFLIHEFGDTEFVNREEDLGLPGLREAKMGYNPDHLVEKFDVVLKK
mgnify:CR=1 FL=1